MNVKFQLTLQPRRPAPAACFFRHYMHQIMILLSVCKPGGRSFFVSAALLLILALLAPTTLAQKEPTKDDHARRKLRPLVAPTALAQEEPVYKTGVVVVQFTPGVSIANKAARAGLQDFDRRAAGYGVHLIERVYPFLDHVLPTPKTRRNLLALRRMYYVRYTADALPKEVVADLASAPGVVYAEPVLINRTQAGRGQRVDPNDPDFGDQPELRLLQLPEAWDVVRGEEGAPRVVIAVVDGGGEWRHEDLHANVWTNPGEVAGNGIDDDDNGFIDDVHGVNFANQDDTDNDPTGLPETPGDALHGTASAGSASAVTDNGVGIAGAAWNAEIMHINTSCGRAETDGEVCYGYEGILYAAANGADIINASWSGLEDTDDQVKLPDQTLDLATDMGALVVAAATNANRNNDFFRYYPARNPRVLSVGATEKASRRRAGFSNYGKLVNVFAPGEDILTTASGNGYVYISGTSFSSPLTAGVAALVKTRFPEMTPDALREHIRLTSDNMDAENPDYAGHLGRGFVNALSAVQAPSLPAVRLKRWSWADRDGNRQIASGDVVTVTATVLNYLSDTRQLTVGLVGAEPYPFIDLTVAEADVGYLASGDSVEVQLEFRIAANAPTNQRVRFYTHIRDGAHEDQADMLSFRVNRSLEEVHRSLSALYTATGGDNWTYNDNWDITRVPTEEELGTWAGVVLSEGWLVTLDLSENNLTEQLPPELGNLTQLQELYLFYNSLTGTIPPEFGNLMQLQVLDMDDNTLTGAIPPELGNLQQLQVLDLRSNTLTGAIPPELGNLQQLQELYLLYNSLTGTIPPEFGNLMQLQTLDLDGNTLTGVIPPELGNLPQLQVLDLRNNTLSGAIPPELGNLTQLQLLYLYGNTLTGTIPPELGNLTQLQELHMYGNTLTGTIPPELGNLSQLEVLSLYDNSLTGVIPPELGNLTQLQSLWLDDNSLTGVIPPELGNLTQLLWLDLYDNTLTGAIPPELGNLTQLEQLDLSNNHLTGVLPRSLMQLNSLESFNFDGQTLCAPSDDAFQGWLAGIPDVSGPTCGSLQFASDMDNRTFTVNRPVASLVLPEATGGATPYTYVLEPALPAGLSFDASLRTIGGTPTAVTPATSYMYSVADNSGNAASLTFTVEVVSGVSFGDMIADLSFALAQPIDPLVLPEAAGGGAPVVYALTPALPTGLAFDATIRTLTGTPTVVTDAPKPYTYSATGANGSRDSLLFTMEVFSPVAAEHESLPASFAVHGNYPNPFQESTRLVFDLPWPASVTVEVMDITGRRVFTVPATEKAAGWKNMISLSGRAMPSGLYLYRLTATSPEGNSVHTGKFVRIK